MASRPWFSAGRYARKQARRSFRSLRRSGFPYTQARVGANNIGQVAYVLRVRRAVNRPLRRRNILGLRMGRRRRGLFRGFGAVRRMRRRRYY